MSDEPFDVALDDGDGENAPSEVDVSEVDPVLSGMPPVEPIEARPVGQESMLARIRRFFSGR
jgi:hypothetical protein